MDDTDHIDWDTLAEKRLGQRPRKRHDEIAALKAESAHAALNQVWELVGAKNQTEAMVRLKELLDGGCACYPVVGDDQ